MPHVILEYSENLEEEVNSSSILSGLHDTMMHCGLFSAENIKSRAYPAKNYLVGTKGRSGSFAHVTAYIMSGRTIEQKQMLSASLLEALNRLAKADQVTVDIRELDKEIYRKL